MVATRGSRARTARHGRVLRVQLASPDTGNALDVAMVADLTDALRRLEDADGAACALLADGANFCVGGDHEEYDQLSAHGQAKLWADVTALFALVASADVPIVIGVQGRAVGGGCELAVVGDFRIAARDARLSLPQVQFGMTVGPGAVQAIAARCGTARARHLCCWAIPSPGRRRRRVGSPALRWRPRTWRPLRSPWPQSSPAFREVRFAAPARPGRRRRGIRQRLQDEARRRGQRAG